MPLPSTFIETLRRLLADPSLSTKNTILDPSMLAYLTDRVNALTSDVTQWFGAPDVLTTGTGVTPTGALGPNVTKNAVKLDIDGFETRLSKFRDGLQSSPRKVRRRFPSDVPPSTPPADRVRYVLADTSDGVLLLDSNLEIVRTFPGLISGVGPIATNQYRDAECAAVGTVATIELMVIACGAQHAVQVLNYATGALVATIGTPGTPGLPSALVPALTDPVSVSIDETNSRLFIACRTGTPPGASASNGFVCEFDITVPATPVFVGYILFDKGLSRLNNSECFQPSDVFHTPLSLLVGGPPARLWVANGIGDVAAFERTLLTDPFVPSLVIEAQGQGYTLGPDKVTVLPADLSENALDVLTVSTVSKLFIAASLVGQVEVFRVSLGDAAVPFGSHEETYGQRGIESTMPFNAVLRVYSTPQQPPLTFGVFSQATGVVADSLTLPGEAVASSVLVVADAEAGRVQRLRTEVYGSDNTVTFTAQTSTVPVSTVGWFLPADSTFPPEFLTLEVRDQGVVADPLATPPILPIVASPWREVPRAGFSVPVQGPAMTRFQFRLRATLPRTAAVQSYQVGALGVLIRQSW